MEFGQCLRDARLKMGMSLEDIEEETKIRKFYIDALEREDFNSLPPQVYASGFVKRYAKMLGLDEQEMVQQFKELAYGQDQEQEPELEPVIEPLPETERKPLPFKNILAGLVFLGLVLWLGSYPASCIARWAKEKPATPTPPKVTQQTQNPQKQPQTNTQTSNTNGVNLKVDAVLRTWLSISVDGKTVYAGTMAVGESKSFEGKTNIHIHTGNAGGIKLTVNGQEIPQLGNVGEIKDKDFKAGS